MLALSRNMLLLLDQPCLCCHLSQTLKRNKREQSALLVLTVHFWFLAVES